MQTYTRIVSIGYRAFSRRLFSIQYHHDPTINKQMITVYGAKYSQPSRSILLLLNELMHPYELIVVDPIKGDTRTPEFRKINPTGLVPCVKVSKGNDRSFVLAECSAILQYICNSYSLHNYYPCEPVERSLVDFWLSWHHHNSRSATLKILLPYVFKNAIPEEGVKVFKKSIKFIESHLEKNNLKFLSSNNHITIADLLILPELGISECECVLGLCSICIMSKCV